MTSRAFGGVLRLLSGNLLGQVVLIGSSLLVARFVVPSEFGIFAIIAAATVTVGSFASLRLELAIPIPPSAREAHSLLHLAIRASLGIGFVFGLILYLVVVHFVEMVEVERGLAFAFLGSISVSLFGIISSLNQAVIRNKKYGRLASRVILQALLTAVTQSGLIIVWPRAESLLIGQVLGQVGGLILLWSLAAGARSSDVRLLVLLKHYKAYPLVSAPSVLLNTMGLHAPLVLGSIMWGTAFAGWFGMSQRVLAIPVGVIGAAIGQVFLGEFTDSLRSQGGGTLSEFKRASVWLGITAVVFLVGVISIAPVAFESILGEDYGESGFYAQALSLGLAAQLFAAPLSSVLPIMGYKAWQAGWDAARLACVTVSIVTAFYAGMGPVSAVWCLGFVQLFLYLVLWRRCLQAVRTHNDKTPRSWQSPEWYSPSAGPS